MQCRLELIPCCNQNVTLNIFIQEIIGFLGIPYYQVHQSSGIFCFMYFHCIGVNTFMPFILEANQSPKTQPLQTWATPPDLPQHRTMNTLSEMRKRGG